MILAGLFVSGAAGAVVASFIATATMRATLGEGALSGRSRCDGCRRPLAFRETAPVVGFVAARGRCGACGADIARLHPLAELTGFAVGAALWAAPDAPTAAGLAMIAAALLASAVHDVRTCRLPDGLTAIVAVCALLLSLQRGEALAGLIAAVAVMVLLGAVRWVFSRRRGDPGLGLGDVKLLAALALWLGDLTPWAAAGAALLGLAAAAARRAKPDERIAFGPMIAAAGWICGWGVEAGWWRV